MADYLVTDTELTGVADAIRTKGGTSAALEWPAGYSQAVAAIPTGITPTGTISITENGSYDVTSYAGASVNVGGSGGGLELLLTYPMGTLSTTSTTAVSTGITLTVPNAGQYPLMLVDVRIDTVASDKHVSTVSYVTLTGNSGGPAGATINSVARSGEFTYRKGARRAIDFNSMSLYGIYVNSATYSSGSVRMNMYMRYDAAYSGTINGTYTARAYGVDLFSLGS